MNQEKSPVLIKLKNGKIVRFMEAIYGKDNSIYFVFPRMKKYLVSNIKKQDFGNAGIIDLERPECEYITPKISFHPGKAVIHFNDETGKKIFSDFEMQSINKSKFLIYFCQIILPKNLDFLDEYAGNHQKYFTINESVLSQNECFSLEIMIHEKNIVIAEGELPECDARNFLIDTTFLGDNKYTCTFFISKYKNNFSEDNNILINVNTKNCHIMYKITPYK